MVPIFHLLNKGNKLKLPEVRRPEEIERTNDLNDCLFHRMVHHLTSKCLVLKDKIQALIDIGDLLLKWEQKKVIVNLLTLNFGTFPKMIVLDGPIPIPKAWLEVINPLAEKQEAKGLTLLTTKSGEIIWVNLDIVKDE